MNPDDAKTIVPKIDATFTPPSDPSQYMRTYAKDVAKLTNSPAPTPTAALAKPESNEADGVSLPDYDASPVNHSGDPSSPKEFKSEVVALSQEDSDGIFTNSSASSTPAAVASAPMSMMPQGNIGVTPNVAPPEETIQEREAILARLRAKLASHETAAVAEPAEPLLQMRPVEPVIPAPVEAAPPAAVPPQFMPPEPPVAPLPVREPVRPPTPAPKAAAAGPSPIHTFSSDFSDRIDSQRASTFSVLATESDARPAAVSSAKPKRPLVIIIAGIVLFLAGIGIVTGAFIYSKKTSAVPTVAGVPSLLTFDESVEVKGTGVTLMQAIADVAGQPSVAGNVVVTYVTTPGVAGSGIPQPGGAIIDQLPLDAPDIVIRNIDQSSTVGTIHAGSESRPFFVLRVNSYERTFAGMLAWEPTMANSLAPFFPAYTDLNPITVATTSSSSSPALPPVTIASPFFGDAVVANHDVRILRDSKGRSLMLYGYHGKDTLIIARDEAAFTAIIARLSATATK
jgi:hypothetical protein